MEKPLRLRLIWNSFVSISIPLASRVTGPFVISLGGRSAASAAGILNAPIIVASDKTAKINMNIVFLIILATFALLSYIWVGEQSARVSAASFKSIYAYRILPGLKDG
jgi:hypothetical protein